jgi:hypothetical protein
MRASNYRIQVAADSVEVECDDPYQSTRTSRFLFGGLNIACALFLLYGSCFAHGRNPSLWMMLADSRPGSPGFAFHVIDAVFVVLLVLLFLLVGIRYFLPFGERLRCDRSTLTWSKIPWMSLGNRWVTHSIPLPEAVRASYGIVYKSKGVYGIVLDTYDEAWKLFWGIESPEANRILRGLKGLGVNVLHDPEMRESIRETLRDRRAQL